MKRSLECLCDLHRERKFLEGVNNILPFWLVSFPTRISVKYHTIMSVMDQVKVFLNLRVLSYFKSRFGALDHPFTMSKSVSSDER